MILDSLVYSTSPINSLQTSWEIESGGMLRKLLSPLQSAFLLNRDTHDNFLITHEIFLNFERKKKQFEYMTLKLDMEKACDCLEWDFIKKCFQVWLSKTSGLIRFGNAYND